MSVIFLKAVKIHLFFNSLYLFIYFLFLLTYQNERCAVGFLTRNVENKQFPFNASATWIQDFNNRHKIRQRHVTKYISSKDNATFEETVKAAELFKKKTVAII
jgi:hypothetical protein